jgi:hypothetical protein
MKLIDCKALTEQILHNCNISDAQHAGIYSICGLALRLRDLFKWEKRLPPWVEKEPAEVLEWIGEKEAHWETLDGVDYQSITIGNASYDPFDTQLLNTLLVPQGMVYGAGYAYSLKPTFFLGQIENQGRINGCQVYTLGREWARDLLTIPAFAQDNCVILRKESAMLYLYDKISYIKKSGRPALNFALTQCGIHKASPQAVQCKLGDIYTAIEDTYIYHEIGELRETAFDREIWREMIAAFPHTPIELLARTVKDLLADTNSAGTLVHLIQERQGAALGFYVAFLDGLGKEIFKNLRSDFMKFMATMDWSIMEASVAAGYQQAKEYAETMTDLFLTGRQKHDDLWTAEQIKTQLLDRF